MSLAPHTRPSGMRAGRVEREGRPIDLTPKEFALLEFLLYHPSQVVTRELIEQHIWNYDFEGSSNVIDVYVRRLRRKQVGRSQEAPGWAWLSSSGSCRRMAARDESRASPAPDRPLR